MKILVLDNYDSFTYNLVHYLKEFCKTKVDVFRNDKITLEDVNNYDKILLSPGPGLPSEAGILIDLIKTYAATKSILGVCLGHQAIGEAFGGTLTNLDKVYHGIATPATILINDKLFNNLESPMTVGRYHSWVVSKDQFPSELEITAEDDNGQIMALRHRTLDIRGVQFHPESILTPQGKIIIKNWLL